MSYGFKRPVVLMSACLLGISCNYKGGCSYDFTKDSRFWLVLNQKYNVIPICPEQLGGLPTPRIPSELQASACDIEAGRGLILNREGADVTHNFVKGAKEALRLAKLYNTQFVVLKSKSPSCGNQVVYDGSFNGLLVAGKGYTAYLLGKAGIKTINEEEFCEKEGCTLSKFLYGKRL